jgi:hypothetical protein
MSVALYVFFFFGDSINAWSGLVWSGTWVRFQLLYLFSSKVKGNEAMCFQILGTRFGNITYLASIFILEASISRVLYAS